MDNDLARQIELRRMIDTVVSEYITFFGQFDPQHFICFAEWASTKFWNLEPGQRWQIHLASRIILKLVDEFHRLTNNRLYKVWENRCAELPSTHIYHRSLVDFLGAQQIFHLFCLEILVSLVAKNQVTAPDSPLMSFVRKIQHLRYGHFFSKQEPS